MPSPWPTPTPPQPTTTPTRTRPPPPASRPCALRNRKPLRPRLDRRHDLLVHAAGRDHLRRLLPRVGDHDLADGVGVNACLGGDGEQAGALQVGDERAW